MLLLNFGFIKTLEPMRIQALLPHPAIERLREGVVGGLSRQGRPSASLSDKKSKLTGTPA